MQTPRPICGLWRNVSYCSFETCGNMFLGASPAFKNITVFQRLGWRRPARSIIGGFFRDTRAANRVRTGPEAGRGEAQGG